MTSAPSRRRPHHRHVPARAAALGLAAVSVLVVAPPAQAQRQQPRVRSDAPAAAAPAGELPLKLAPRPTSPAISAADLMTRLYVFADDSMLGREAGTIGNVKATDYIAGELRRMGLQPAGDSGTYFQTVPMVMRAFDPRSSLSVEGVARVAAWEDYAPVSATLLEGAAAARRFGDVRAIYGGRLGDSAATITPEQVAGKLVVLAPAVNAAGMPTFEFWNKGGIARFRGAAGVAIATLDISPPGVSMYLQMPQADLADPADTTSRPFVMLVTGGLAEKMLGATFSRLTPGAVGRTVRGDLRFAATPTPAPARNVVAVLPGSDARLRGEYVAIGAHNDHVGMVEEVADHDSLRAFNRVLRPMGAESPQSPATPEQLRAAKALLDSLRRAHPAARVDSVNNGADDDGSGSVSVLEIAEALATAPVKPKRSILFVWHTGEEKGLFGSRWFSDHPTVPRDSIVAQLNIDMIGRGDARDLPGGGPGYVQLIGSRRLSTELGDLVERVNKERDAGLTFDYQFDANGHPLQYYCRSDHYEYARFGIPIVFFSTGGHQDYHMPTDEPQYIDYDHMARVAGFVRDVAVTAANLDHRLVVDKPKPDPNGSCVQ